MTLETISIESNQLVCITVNLSVVTNKKKNRSLERARISKTLINKIKIYLFFFFEGSL